MILKFLETLFNEAGGDICIYDEDNDTVEASFNSLVNAAAYAQKQDIPGVDLMTHGPDGEVVGFLDNTLNPDKATFWMEHRDDSSAGLAVYMLDIEGEGPYSASALRETADTFIPLPSDVWRVVGKTNDLFSHADVEELYSGDSPSPSDPPVDGPVHSEADHEAADGEAGPEDDSDAGTNDNRYDFAADAAAAAFPEGELIGIDEDPELDNDGEFLSAVTADEADFVAGVDPSAPPPDDIQDAEVLGKEHPDMLTLLDRNVVFITGSLYKKVKGRDHRDTTRGGGWKRNVMPWANLMIGGEVSGAEWGLSRHPVSPQKEGTCIVYADSVGGERLKTAITDIYAMGLDIDSGVKLDDALARIEELGLFCFVHTSYNHMTDTMHFKREAVMNKLRIKKVPTLGDVQVYMRDHLNDRYPPAFIAGIEMLEPTQDPQEGFQVNIKTPPLEKFRLIFPLMEPVNFPDLAPLESDRVRIWEDKITGLAINLLGFESFDAACTDVGRLFFWPRHRKDDDNWYSAVIMGRPLTYEEVEPASKKAYIAGEVSNVFTTAGSDPVEERKQYTSPSGASLNAWHSKFGERFMISDLLETHCEDKLRVSGGEMEGGVHLECPFEHLHSKTGGTATMAINSVDTNEGWWTVFCHHDSCQGHHKLEFLQQMLADDWFDEKHLFTNEFMVAGEDEDEDEAVDEGETLRAADEKYEPPEARAAALSSDATEEDVTALIAEAHKEGTDVLGWGRVKGALKKAVDLSATDFTKLKKGVIKEADRILAESAEDDPEAFNGHPVIREWGDDDMAEYVIKRVNDTNVKEPFMFKYMRGVNRITTDEKGLSYIQELETKRFAYELSRVCSFKERIGQGDESVLRPCFPPKIIADNLYGRTWEELPGLRGIVNTPLFTEDGSLLDTQGYHTPSQLYYMHDETLEIPRVALDPSEEDVAEAKRLIIEEVLGDFPLGGHTRKELINIGLHGKGIPALTNMVGLLILPFSRELIKGPTPGHLMTKPTPGSGASLLAALVCSIATGQRGPASTFPSNAGRKDSNKPEVQKTLFSLFRAGTPIIWFDNIDESIESPELASALTSPIYNARVLGTNDTYPVAVRSVWIFTGNNIVLSSELIRRLCLIDLDANMVDPSKRTGWRHSDINGWVDENRGLLVWACLTLIQNWIADGMPDPSEGSEVVGSYEEWTRVIGGILESAELGGFMGNREIMKERSNDDEGEGIQTFIDVIWAAHGTTMAYIAENHEDRAALSLISTCLKASIDIPGVDRKRVDDVSTLNPISFGKVMQHLQGRVFEVGDEGIQVKVTRSENRTKRGNTWGLTVLNDRMGDVTPEGTECPS